MLRKIYATLRNFPYTIQDAHASIPQIISKPIEITSFIIPHQRQFLKKTKRTVHQNGRMDYANSDVQTAAMILNQKIYSESLLAPRIFIDNFTAIFDFVAFFLEKIEIYFESFLFMKFLLKIKVKNIKALKVIKLTSCTMNFWKLMLIATHTFFVFHFSPQFFLNEKNQEPQSNSTKKTIT